MLVRYKHFMVTSNRCGFYVEMGSCGILLPFNGKIVVFYFPFESLRGLVWFDMAYLIVSLVTSFLDFTFEHGKICFL